ncbi:MAG: tyrosine/phenylalanine carboxypeptidase domain-containing protein [Polyangiaceae bacterium]
MTRRFVVSPPQVSSPLGSKPEPETFELCALDAFLLRVEGEVRLLDRVRPPNAARSLAEARKSFVAGQPRAPEHPRFESPGFGDLRRLLEKLGQRLGRAGPWGELYAARVHELALEAAIVDALGSSDVVSLAAQRFPEESGAAGQQARVWARAWLEPPEANESEPTFRSDDVGASQSLIRQLESELRDNALDVRIQLEPDLQSRAAVGQGVIYLKPAQWLTERTARRLVLHEVHGHVLPREAARRSHGGLFLVGSQGGSDDEEGRALLLEKRHLLLDSERRFELALRHEAARQARAGADFVELVELSLALGADLDMGLRIAERARRGGGLGRELVYLPALQRVESAFATAPELEGWLCRGRVSIEAARVLAELGPAPHRLAA